MVLKVFSKFKRFCGEVCSAHAYELSNEKFQSRKNLSESRKQRGLRKNAGITLSQYPESICNNPPAKYVICQRPNQQAALCTQFNPFVNSAEYSPTKDVSNVGAKIDFLTL